MSLPSSKPSIRLTREPLGFRSRRSRPIDDGHERELEETVTELPEGAHQSDDGERLPFPRARLAPETTDGDPVAAGSSVQANPQSSLLPENAVSRPEGTSPPAGFLASLNRTWTRQQRAESPTRADEYGADVVHILDVVDPEVSTLTTLTNVQNSLMVPDLGPWLDRRPTYSLSPQAPDLTPGVSEPRAYSTDGFEGRDSVTLRPESGVETESTKLRFAVLPEDISLERWSLAEMHDMDDHVRHMLHSRRSKFKRSMKGFWKYVKRPLGFLVTLYIVLITLFGLAWVLFLIGWINVGGQQLYAIHVIDLVLVALFAVVGDGLAPFRAVDTYHMIFIARYHFLTWRLRRERSLPKLRNKNDLPTVSVIDIAGQSPSDVEEQSIPKQYPEFSVLTLKQQRRLTHHQTKFAKSHTFYKPHETNTHHAFPVRFLIAIVVLLDFHSLFQIALGACTWGIDYRVRPFALTTTILCCSISCNTAAGILIMMGDRRTRKKEVIERMRRQELTKEAVAKVCKRKDGGKSDQKGKKGRASREFAEVKLSD